MAQPVRSLVLAIRRRVDLAVHVILLPLITKPIGKGLAPRLAKLQRPGLSLHDPCADLRKSGQLRGKCQPRRAAGRVAELVEI